MLNTNKIIESLYFSCYYAYLSGNFINTSMYYYLLKEEFKISGHINALKNYQLSELKKIKESLSSGNIPRNNWLNENHSYNPTITPNKDLNQKELIEIIHSKGLNQFKEILEDNNLQIYNIEHPCKEYGKVDIVYTGKNTIYPIEVKRDKGEHNLIGQIYKYDLYHKLQLHYGHYEKVQSITICRAYNPLVANELTQMGIIPLIYNIVDNDIIIKKI